MVKRTLMFFLLLAAGLVIYSLWYGLKADRHDETVVPYLDSAIPELTSWHYPRLKVLLSPQARVEFETEAGQSAYRLFSQLGSLQSIGSPKYLGDKSDTTSGLGEVEIIAYQVPLTFDTGPAVIKLHLANDGQSYYVHHFGIHSELFMQADGNN